MLGDFRELIAARRDGLTHSQQDLIKVAEAAAKASVPDYQLAAWLMAAFLKPLGLQETTWLTQAIADSGERLDLSRLPKPWVDKHSTGGVGDKTSIVLLPLLAACGVTVVKMSGPGLGITGGTVDKLRSIPGFRMELSPDELLNQALRIGLAITGQTPDLAPADKALYALRDATATTQSIPLIVSSILGKKLAAGAETIVLDVKCGTGGFMATLPEAEGLSSVLLEVGRQCGLNIRIAITDMSQPLGSAVGNALEVQEALQVLREQPDKLADPTRRFRTLCLHFAGEVLVATGLTGSEAEGQAEAKRALDSGEAAKKAEDWIAAQGGPISLAQTEASLPRAPAKRTVRAERGGFVNLIAADEIGATVVALGGGRRQKTDKIDPSVGLIVHTQVGSQVNKGSPLLTIYAASGAAAEKAEELLVQSVKISRDPVEPPPLILRHYK